MSVNSLPKEITCRKSGADRDSNPSYLAYERGDSLRPLDQHVPHYIRMLSLSSSSFYARIFRAFMGWTVSPTYSLLLFQFKCRPLFIYRELTCVCQTQQCAYKAYVTCSEFVIVSTGTFAIETQQIYPCARMMCDNSISRTKMSSTIRICTSAQNKINHCLQTAYDV